MFLVLDDVPDDSEEHLEDGDDNHHEEDDNYSEVDDRCFVDTGCLRKKSFLGFFIYFLEVLLLRTHSNIFI